MKKIAFVTALSLTTSIATAATPINGWYSSAFGGYAWTPGNMNTTTLGLTRSNTLYQSGFDAGGSLGFKSNPMRYEGELTYIRANLKRFDVNGIRQTEPEGYTNAALGLANVYYDFPGLTAPLQPFLGAGIGYAWVQNKLNSTGSFGITSFSNANSVFAYQATGGLTYNFAENYALSLGYRYVATTNVTEFGQMYQAHLANIGAIYRFDGKNYA